jgi:Uma2 family endonuclease
MVTQLTSETVYPESDGKPMADNTKQYLWIVLIKEGLELLFQPNPNVFIAADLLWYPVVGNNRIVVAPDVMVVWGRPKGHRGSYQQWQEDNISPQVVFEIRSPGNRQTEMDEKLVFYDRYGVEEYYLYDPDQNDLSGWLRVEGRLQVINPIDSWTSPRLGIQFNLSREALQIIRPDGESFINYVEMAHQREQERQRAEQERQRAEQAEARVARLAEQLRSQGIDPDTL